MQQLVNIAYWGTLHREYQVYTLPSLFGLFGWIVFGWIVQQEGRLSRGGFANETNNKARGNFSTRLLLRPNQPDSGSIAQNET